MGRQRKALKMIQEARGKAWVAYFRHPVKNRTVRFPLGDSPGVAKTALDWLNTVFMIEANWTKAPAGLPKDIADAWGFDDGSIETLPGGKLRQRKKEIPVDRDELAAAKMDAEFYRVEYEKLLLEFKALRKEAEHWRGRKLRTGPSPTLKKAFDTFMGNYKGRDADHTKNVRYDLERFMLHFDPAGDGREAGESIEVDELSGREKDIDSWLRGLVTSKNLPLGAGRRDQIRKIVLKFLEDSDVAIDRKAITRAGKKEVRADRGAIRWLERSLADAVANALEAPWNDYFRIQVAMGFRPDELLTLKRADFSGENFEMVALSPLDHLTLKQGSRRIRVPEALREILMRRFEENALYLFPDPKTGKPWGDPKKYNLQYNAALKKAGAAAGVPFTMDCRIGRRTCASLLLREGVGVERVASMLGDDPKTVREHYAAILPHEVDSTPAALKPASTV